MRTNEQESGLSYMHEKQCDRDGTQAERIKLIQRSANRWENAKLHRENREVKRLK